MGKLKTLVQNELVPGFCKLNLSSFALLYGTAWKKEKTTSLVTEAFAAGFRGVDTACQPKHYQEDLVGDALLKAFSSGQLKREEVWVQTKFTSIRSQDPKRIPYHSCKSLPEQVAESVQVSRNNLKVEVIDSLVLHTPENDLKTTLLIWGAMETAVHAGYVRNLGISNCYDFSLLKKLYDAVSIKPIVVQNRFYKDSNWDRSIRKFCLEKNIKYQSFWTLTANPDILNNAGFKTIAEKYQLTPQQLMYKFLVDTGCQPLSGTTTHHHEVAQVIGLKFKLSDFEISIIDATME